MSTQLKQGETKQLAIGIAPGQNFDEEVTLKFTGLPKGVTFDPASPVIKRGEKETQLTIKVADDASPEDFMVKMTGTLRKAPTPKTSSRLLLPRSSCYATANKEMPAYALSRTSTCPEAIADTQGSVAFVS